MAKGNSSNNGVLVLGVAAVAAAAIFVGAKSSPKPKKKPKPRLVPRTVVYRTPVSKIRAAAPVPVAKPKSKPPTKQQQKKKAAAQRKAARNTPERRAERLQKTGMALDFITNFANTAASAAGQFKKT